MKPVNSYDVKYSYDIVLWTNNNYKLFVGEIWGIGIFII
ncbi:Conserved hypothetical protein [Clostridium neonatale]|uniref:Uncharacterized protein n=1 Tax=Clostridium neonatale TaxID=137838 RepID=A0AA86JUT7_9CLOT|nr:Conserved hypothetical protein [Clostridium neonatale]CAG9712476.1 Conserved hypothetical protein [Clostridium neonatale]CAG9716078.1 Conserved hypothetical protein [Clostridium neonatale]CAH0436148.1 Conserved hypothetical protein [Clostridium neonatale]CAI3197453.1 Conserved hypothetical protein [Clostridium neonatale]